MATYDFAAHRLFVDAPLAAGLTVALDGRASHYLLNVLRLAEGREILVFNGRDGEWRARIELSGRKSAALVPTEPTRPQPSRSGLAYLFAPLKHARLDYMVQKAVEMGVDDLRPVITRRTVPTRVNHDRMRLNAIEAAEQCGVLGVPAIAAETSLPAALADLSSDRLLVFCDEDAPLANPTDALRGAGRESTGVALVVGPEGGFDPEERALLLRRENVCRISLGPRILRADTAAVAALAIVQSALGDWR